MKFQGTSPPLSGVLQSDEKDPKKRKTLGKIVLWSNESENEKAPKFRGVLDIPDKGKFRIALWDNGKEEKGEESPPSSTAAKLDEARSSSADIASACLRRATCSGTPATSVRQKRRGCNIVDTSF